jgi:fructose-specific phosphotransferase system IIC component
MTIIKGIALLLLVLALFTLFSYRAPYGMKAMGGLANAAIASFLVEAFQRYIGGDMLQIELLKEVGISAGSLPGVAAAILVPLALGVSPVYAVLIGLSCSGMGILPGFFAGYIMAFVVKEIEKRVPEGLDLIVCVVVVAPLARLVAVATDPLVNATLGTIGETITLATNESPVVMGLALGGLITVISTSPLSSMALTAMLGLTGLPMAIGALSLISSSFMNFLLFKKLNIGTKRENIAVAIEPLTQADLVSANPVPIYSTNFVGGALAGVIVALFGFVNNAPGTASPVPGLLVMYGFNDPMAVTIAAILCSLVGIVVGYIAVYVFRNYKVLNVAQVRGDK